MVWFSVYMHQSKAVHHRIIRRLILTSPFGCSVALLRTAICTTASILDKSVLSIFNMWNAWECWFQKWWICQIGDTHNNNKEAIVLSANSMLSTVNCRYFYAFLLLLFFWSPTTIFVVFFFFSFLTPFETMTIQCWQCTAHMQKTKLRMCNVHVSRISPPCVSDTFHLANLLTCIVSLLSHSDLNCFKSLCAEFIGYSEIKMLAMCVIVRFSQQCDIWLYNHHQCWVTYKTANAPEFSKKRGKREKSLHTQKRI